MNHFFVPNRLKGDKKTLSSHLETSHFPSRGSVNDKPLLQSIEAR